LTYQYGLSILTPNSAGTIISNKTDQGEKTMAQMKERRKFNFVLLAILVIVIVAGIFYQFFLKF
jgi:hypothetical protein